MKKVIFFDFDGVLSLNNSGTVQTCKYLSKKTGIDYDLLFSSSHKLSLDLLIGNKSYFEIWKQFCDFVGKDINMKLLDEAFLSTPINKSMLDLVMKLKNLGYIVGIITDNPKERFEMISTKYGFNEIFDSIIVSSNVGGLKNEEKIFNVALNSLKASPKDTIFIDNSPKNLVVPSNMGIKTYFHDDKNNDINLLISFLDSNGISIN